VLPGGGYGSAGKAGAKYWDESLAVAKLDDAAGFTVSRGRRLPFNDADRLTEVNRTLDRIEAGGPFPYKKDGTVFQNREGVLPAGNYREYTVDTPGAAGRGQRRIVMDQDTGRTYYTDNHYGSFVQIDPTLR
jgi:guanyl-specific ribonuclease Sa